MSLLLRRRALLMRLQKFLRTIIGVPPVSCPACVDDSVVDYKIYGNSFQDGTPTPDTPVEVESVGEKTKNLFDVNKIVTKSNVINNGDGSLTVTGTGVNSGKIFSEICPELKVGDVVSFSCRITNALQDTKNGAYIYIQGTGANCSLTTGKPFTVTQEILDGKVLLYCRIYGTDIEATPTGVISELQVEYGETSTSYEPYGKYKIPVVAQGKNLLPYPYLHTTKIVNGITFTDNGDGSITISGKNTSSGDTYFYFSNKDFGNSNMWNNTQNSNGYIVSGCKHFFYNGKNKISCIAITSGTDYSTTPLTVRPQIEYGTTATDYEPYQEPIETNIYLDEPLRKVGEYADYVDFANGKVVRNIKRVNLTGSGIYYKWLDRVGAYFSNRLDDSYNMNKNAISNRCGYWTSKDAYDTNKVVMWLGVNNKVIYWVGILDYLGFTTVDELKAWLAENPTYIYYASNTPTETLIDLPQLPTLKNHTTVYTINTELLPSNMEVTYYSKESAENVL